MFSNVSNIDNGLVACQNMRHLKKTHCAGGLSKDWYLNLMAMMCNNTLVLYHKDMSLILLENVSYNSVIRYRDMNRRTGMLCCSYGVCVKIVVYIFDPSN